MVYVHIEYDSCFWVVHRAVRRFRDGGQGGLAHTKVCHEQVRWPALDLSTRSQYMNTYNLYRRRLN